MTWVTENENGVSFTRINTESFLSWIADPSWNPNMPEGFIGLESRIRVLIARSVGVEARERFEKMTQYDPDHGAAREVAVEWLMARRHQGSSCDRTFLRKMIRKVYGSEGFIFADDIIGL